jgi:hypothetical protein
MRGGSPTGERLWATQASEWWEAGPTMRLCRPDTPNPGSGVFRAETIVFTKPKEFGRWYYMYHIDPGQFWHFFGGKLVKFFWEYDNCSCGFGFLRNQPALVFRTGFEVPDFHPNWAFGDPERIQNVRNARCFSTAGFDYEEPPPAHVGSHSLVYVGNAYRYTSRAYPPLCYFKDFNVDLYIHSETWLIYWIYPTTDLGRYVGVDFVCTNGETLRASGAVDWVSASMNPSAGHRFRTYKGGYSELPLNKWTPIACHVGRWLPSRTIDRVLVSFQLPPPLGHHGLVRGLHRHHLSGRGSVWLLGEPRSNHPQPF